MRPWILGIIFCFARCSSAQSSGCGDDSLHFASSETAWIESPGYGESTYPEDLDCNWVIQARSVNFLERQMNNWGYSRRHRKEFWSTFGSMILFTLRPAIVGSVTTR